MLLNDKTVIVTGGNSGIGAATVRAAAAEGANVVIDYVADPEETQRLVDEIEERGGRAIGMQADVSRVADVAALVQATVEHFGRLDVMINNAGMGTNTSVLEATEEEFDQVTGINLKGAFFGTQMAARQFIKQGGGGVIVNVSSVHEDWPMPGNTAYCASKGGIRMLTRTAGVELAEHNVRVVNVCPGAVATPMNRQTMDDPEQKQTLDAAIPLGRMGGPDEIADTVTFVASERAGYLTATSVFVDGGLMQDSVGL